MGTMVWRVLGTGGAVLAGVLALLHSWRSEGVRAGAWAVLAGAAAAAAPLVKQNVVDVFVVLLALILQAHRGASRRRAVERALGAALGAALVTTGCLVWAEVRGTEPSLLWVAIVTFRGEAAAVISSSSTNSWRIRSW